MDSHGPGAGGGDDQRGAGDPSSFTCPQCGRTSHHPVDAEQGYCGACHDWTGRPQGYLAFYDRDGNPVSFERFAALIADPGYRLLARSMVRGWLVSTIWGGINHRFGSHGPPLIFETMTFPPGESLESAEAGMERYATEAAARAGHDRAVAAVVAELGADLAEVEVL